MVTMSTGRPEPSTDRTTKAKIKRRHRQQQVDQPRQRLIDPAAGHGRANPVTMPMKNDSAVMISARPIDRRAP